MSIGERIAQLRQENNISQQQLSNALGVSRQAVSKWENDQTSPDTINLIRLADILNTEVEYLATGKQPIYTATPCNVKTVEKIVEVEKIIKIPEKITIERIVKIPEIVEKPIFKIKYRTKHVRNPFEYILIGLACFSLGLIVGLFF